MGNIQSNKTNQKHQREGTNSNSSQCPIPEEMRNQNPIYDVYSRRIDSQLNSKSEITIDKRNNMPMGLNDKPAPGQRIPISTERILSTIPKSGTDTTWLYPSPQMFFNALKRKGKGDDIIEEDMESVVIAHNMLNEATWDKVMLWEKLHDDICKCPKLLRFEGKPDHLSPRARIKKLLGNEAPFDRHDWFINRCGKEIRYVIDFYFDESQAGTSDAFEIDARPALDSFENLHDRIKMNIYRVFVKYGWPCPISGHSSLKDNVSKNNV